MIHAFSKEMQVANENREEKSNTQKVKIPTPNRKKKGPEKTPAEIVDSIKELYLKKAKLYETKAMIKGKILLEKQIGEEIVRRHNEDIELLKEEKEELEDTMEKKVASILQHKKKFREVEIYARREFKNKTSNPDIYLFSMARFLNINERNGRESIFMKEYINQIVFDKCEFTKAVYLFQERSGNQTKDEATLHDSIIKFIYAALTKQKRRDLLRFILRYFLDFTSKISKSRLYIYFKPMSTPKQTLLGLSKKASTIDYLSNINVVTEVLNNQAKFQQTEFNFQDYYMSNISQVQTENFGTNTKKEVKLQALQNTQNVFNNININNNIIINAGKLGDHIYNEITSNPKPFKIAESKKNEDDESFVNISGMDESAIKADGVRDSIRTQNFVWDISHIEGQNDIIQVKREKDKLSMDISYLISKINGS